MSHQIGQLLHARQRSRRWSPGRAGRTGGLMPSFVYFVHVPVGGPFSKMLKQGGLNQSCVRDGCPNTSPGGNRDMIGWQRDCSMCLQSLHPSHKFSNFTMISMHRSNAIIQVRASPCLLLLCSFDDFMILSSNIVPGCSHRSSRSEAAATEVSMTW